MSNIDHAFFGAYRPNSLTGNPLGQRQRPPTKPSGTSSHSGDRSRAKSVEQEYCDVTWYRLDPQHDETEIPAAAHRRPGSSGPTARTVESHTTDVGYGTVTAEWQDSCLIITPTFTSNDVQNNDALKDAVRAPSHSVVETRSALGPHTRRRAESVVKPARTPTPVVTPPPRAEEPSYFYAESDSDAESDELDATSYAHDDSEERHEDDGIEPTSPVVERTTVERAAVTRTATKQVEESTVEPTWKAVWEVDEFGWPTEVDRLYETQCDYFRYAGEKLCDASREGLRVLAVMSTREKEGCTTMAICLARAAAAAGAKVALMDGNLSHPELGFRMGLEFSRGWQDALDGASLAEAAVMSLDQDLTLFPLSAAHKLASLNDAGVSRVLREAAKKFDLVITDTGALPSGDISCFESGNDCPVHAALIVRDVRRTSETETLVTASRLKSLGLEAIGIAENFLPHRPVQSAAA